MEVICTIDIAQAIGAQCRFNANIKSISTDSRTIEEGSLFVAIEGENFDGHDFIAIALRKGASAVISHKKLDFDDDKIIYVDDTVKALLSIAKMYKSKFNVKTVGVTGSVGKTTSKDFIECVVSSKYKTLKSVGNENNEIGLPKTIFKLDKTYEACVLEMGMSNFGEISELSKVSMPDIAVITNIGVCHLEYLKTRENILKAKMEICHGMKKNSPLILCVDNDLLSQVESEDYHIIKYGIENKNADICAENITEENGKTFFTVNYFGEKLSAQIPTIGTHNVQNALAAIAVGGEMDIEPKIAVKALEKYIPSGMRQKFVELDDIIIVEDCYNASPDSMKAAMKTFGEYKCSGRKIAVLGDMLELGAISEKAHSEIGDILSSNSIDEVFTYGDEMKYCTKRAYELGIPAANYDDKAELTKELIATIKKCDVIWFKGSHGMKLEEIINEIYKNYGKESTSGGK